jgi:NADH-quinone oxidoreductase subunit M
VLAIIGIIYGALVAMVQVDLKRLVAYSSVSHLGFVVLGIFAFHPISIQGAVYQMLNHGISTGALFLCVGMLYDRRHTHLISEFGGLATPMPVLAALYLFSCFASAGLPMLNGFVGEFLILAGTFEKHAMWAAWAALGVIFSAVYLLWSYQRVFFGSITQDKNGKLADLDWRERGILCVMVIFMLWMGIGSTDFTRRTEASAQNVLQLMQRPGGYNAVVVPGNSGNSGLNAERADRASTALRDSAGKPVYVDYTFGVRPR